jgi:hypothetical protein
MTPYCDPLLAKIVAIEGAGNDGYHRSAQRDDDRLATRGPAAEPPRSTRKVLVAAPFASRPCTTRTSLSSGEGLTKAQPRLFSEREDPSRHQGRALRGAPRAWMPPRRRRSMARPGAASRAAAAAGAVSSTDVVSAVNAHSYRQCRSTTSVNVVGGSDQASESAGWIADPISRPRQRHQRRERLAAELRAEPGRAMTSARRDEPRRRPGPRSRAGRRGHNYCRTKISLIAPRSTSPRGDMEGAPTTSSGCAVARRAPECRAGATTEAAASPCSRR